MLNSEKTVLIDFYADWCGPCKMLSRVLEELSDEYSDIDFYKLNVDSNSQLADTFNIISIPNVMIFKHGEITDNISGYRAKQEMKIFLNNNR